MINKKKAETTENKPKYEAKVLTARVIKETEKEQVISFNLLVNGITIYDMIYRSGVSKKNNEYELISFPSRKGSNGIYYNHVWFSISKELETAIMDMIAEKIDEGGEK